MKRLTFFSLFLIPACVLAQGALDAVGLKRYEPSRYAVSEDSPFAAGSRVASRGPSRASQDLAVVGVSSYEDRKVVTVMNLKTREVWRLDSEAKASSGGSEMRLVSLYEDPDPKRVVAQVEWEGRGIEVRFQSRRSASSGSVNVASSPGTTNSGPEPPSVLRSARGDGEGSGGQGKGNRKTTKRPTPNETSRRQLMLPGDR